MASVACAVADEPGMALAQACDLSSGCASIGGRFLPFPESEVQDARGYEIFGASLRAGRAQLAGRSQRVFNHADISQVRAAVCLQTVRRVGPDFHRLDR